MLLNGPGKSYTDHIEVLLDTYAYELGNLNSRLTRIIKQIDATEDLLNLRLENVQKNTFIANAFFHMILSFLGFPTAIAGIFGMNLWSGLKFDLSGPMNKGVNFTPPFYPVDQYDNDKNLGPSWTFLQNSIGVSILTILMIIFTCLYMRLRGLLRIRV